MGHCVSGDLSGSFCPVLGRTQKMTRVRSQYEDLAGSLSDFSAEPQASPNTVGAKEWYHHHMVETGQSKSAHHVESGGIVVPQNDGFVGCLANSELAEVGLAFPMLV